MAAGQLVLALATTLPLAVAARVLIGTGDGRRGEYALTSGALLVPLPQLA
jgi:hypothetical protein